MRTWRELYSAAVLETNPDRYPAREIAEMLDSDEIAIKEDWIAKFRVTSWLEAYLNTRCRNLVERMISGDKRRLDELTVLPR